MEIPGIENWTILLGIIGPAIVGSVTGLNTPKEVKALLAIAIVTAFTAFNVWQSGGWTGDLTGNLVVTVVTWQAFYGMLWKGTGINKILQEKIPIKFGEVANVEPVVTDECL